MSEQQQEWSSVEPFFIDDGQLDGISAANAFVLGVEWQMVYSQLKSGEPFERPVHAANRERLTRLCIRNGRRCEVTKPEDGWCHLIVASATN